MPMARLTIDQTFAQHGIRIQKPVQQIEQPKAELNLRQEPAVMEIRQPVAILTINSTRAKEAIGIKTPLPFSDDQAAYGKQQLMEAIAQMSQEGDRLAAIENKANAIASLAFEKGFREPSYFPVTPSHDEGVDVSFETHRPTIHVERRGMRMDPEIKPIVHEYTPAKVEGYMLQWPRVEIDVVGLHVDRRM
ncbi:DUF6470 family protein [Brevibacillus humidisoli]|uniref:DUF6470 family protein n=1 Tax=Brevibacillus humidisoli TaxID=2895522 RepID=UPI001E455347|nr:DUF6470 family protein [Brevibacillus humidisoli]UFJ40059.1 DUF6470 family protein [Brevibacillus humidisoli]